MKNLIIGTIALVFFSLSSSGQRRLSGEDMEQFKSQKISFITEKLNLTPKEAQEFWPVYNQFEKEKMDIQQSRRELEQRTLNEDIRMSDQEVIRVTRSIAASHKKEAALLETYNERFLKVLPPQKVLQLYRAENQFRAHMFEQFRKRRQDQ